MKKEKCSGRRDFLKTAAAGAAGLAVFSPQDLLAKPVAALEKGPGNKWEGRVVVNFNKSAVSNMVANEQVIKKMVDDSIKLLTGESIVGNAWKAIFPSSLNAQSTIAIKICILNNGLPAPHAFSVMGITEGLLQMDFSGTSFPASNITIYDMNNGNTMDSAGYTAARFPGISRIKDTAQAFGDGAANNRAYARTLNACDFLINVFGARGQSEDVEYFTLGFKSHFGTYANPSALHGSPARAALRDFNCTGPVFQKSVLSVCSGIYGMNEGIGPHGAPNIYTNYAQRIDPTSTTQCPTTIIMSSDPVSAEMQAIKMMRLNKNPPGSYTVSAMPAYLRASAGISGALTPTYNIGIIDEANMDVRRIINEVVLSTVMQRKAFSGKSGGGIAIKKIGKSAVFIEYALGEEYAGGTAILKICDARGVVVRRLSQKVLEYLNHFCWDKKNSEGSFVPKGMYAIHIKIAGKHLFSRVAII